VRAVSAAIAALRDEANGAKRLSDIRSDVQVLRRCLADIGQARSSYEAFRTELQCDLPFTLEALRAMEASQETLGQAPLDTLGLRHSGLDVRDPTACTSVVSSWPVAGHCLPLRSINPVRVNTCDRRSHR